jgi:gamma-glutamyltranspeptidase/glutathione hydrolase
VKGAVAAGHPHTAEAGARILAEGGNAVDACIAAAFVAWVAESPLTGPGAGGFMLVHRARDGADMLLDFFVAAPGLGRRAAGAPMEEVEVRFDRRTTQVFLVGPAACAVPGMVAGLAEAHRRYARLPWPELLQPALELARGGVTLSAEQAYLHAILDPVLRRDAEGRLIYGRDGPVSSGGRVVMPHLAATLELLAAEGPAAFYRGELARRIVAAVRDGGGRLTARDLAAYRVVARRPVRIRFRGTEFVSNPPPSAGGVLVAYSLAILDRLARAPHGSVPAAELLAESMREAARARGRSFTSALHRGGLAARLLAGEEVGRAVRRVRSRSRTRAGEPAGLPSTTHVSVVDGDGNAASLSSSTGCGSGVFVPGSGIHLNNMLGEIDLNPPGRLPVAGRRLSSMMAPSLVLAEGRPRLVVGSAGSERLRSAILQVVVNTVDHGLGARAAIAAPRVYLDGSQLHVEGGGDSSVADGLEAAGYDVVRWRRRNLFFGGAAAVARRNGRLEAAGDPRRGGAGVVVR